MTRLHLQQKFVAEKCQKWQSLWPKSVQASLGTAQDYTCQPIPWLYLPTHPVVIPANAIRGSVNTFVGPASRQPDQLPISFRRWRCSHHLRCYSVEDRVGIENAPSTWSWVIPIRVTLITLRPCRNLATGTRWTRHSTLPLMRKLVGRVGMREA